MGLYLIVKQVEKRKVKGILLFTTEKWKNLVALFSVKRKKAVTESCKYPSLAKTL